MRRLLSAVAASMLAVTASLAIESPAFADKIRNDQWQVSYLELAKAHQISQGEGITVAVVDSGIDPNHPDLTGNVLTGFDVVTGGSGNGWGDADGHGTGMAGLVAAHGHGAGNDDGALGVAPKAKILPVRIDTGSGNGAGDAMAIAVDEAVKRGAKIISISITTDNRAYDPIQKAIKAGVIVVASVGNRPKAHFIGDPALYPGVLAVGATGKDGNVADVSVRGRAVALVAPGVDIVSTSKNGKYRIGTGTSPSTAIVAGAAALVWSKYPQLTGPQVIDHLTRTAVDKGSPGRDDEYGFGVVDVVTALNTAPSTASASVTPTSQAATSGPSTPKEKPSALEEKLSTPEEKRSNTGLFIGIGAAVLVAIIAIVAVTRRRRGSSG
jgi:type VII secretion-associated serine protease mycosin